MSKIFPIKSDTACLLKWGWSTIFFHSGSTASCHRTKKYTIDPDAFDTFHNLPEKIQARQNMLDGQWPGAGCEYCRDIELTGGVSDRQMQLEMQQDPDLSPPELAANPAATSVTPTMLEVYFNNTCNMKCIYCGPHHSSAWENENRQFQELSGLFTPEVLSVSRSQNNPNYQSMVDDLWKYLSKDDRYNKLKRYHILGGEPFLMPEMDTSIDFWNNHPNPNLTFAVITNLNIPHQRFRNYMDRFKDLIFQNKIGQLQITASIDSWGPQQEYARFGLDSDLWKINFEYVLKETWTQPSINSAISALTIKQMPVLLHMINLWNKAVNDDRKIVHSFNTSSNLDSIYNFGSDVFADDFIKILSLMPEDTNIQRSQKIAMQGIQNKYSQCQHSPQKINHFKSYLDILDQRRKTNWRVLFPWLDQDFPA
jgi:organic radical activating enzyme